MSEEPARVAKMEGLSRFPEQRHAMIQVLQEGNDVARLSAAGELGKLGRPEAVPALNQALAVKSWAVRPEAAEALRKLSPPCS